MPTTVFRARLDLFCLLLLVSIPLRLAAQQSGPILIWDGHTWQPSTWLSVSPGGVTSIQMVPISATLPTLGQVLEFDGTRWTPVTLSNGSGGTLPSSGSTQTNPALITPTDWATFNGKQNAIVANTYDAYGAAATAQSTSLQKNANLGDVVSVPTVRINLGLGSAALLSSSAFDLAGTAATAIGALRVGRSSGQAAMTSRALCHGS